MIRQSPPYRSTSVSEAIRERVLASQRSRRVVRAAIGPEHGWDYEPGRDAAAEYARDHTTYAQIGASSRVSIPA